MAVVVNTAQGIGQPIRGTCLTSLGSTGIVAAFWNGSAVEHNTLIVPEFGTSVELTVYSTLPSPTVTLARAWGEAPQEIANPLRNWPQDINPALATDGKLWVQIAGTTLGNYALAPGSSTVRVSRASKMGIQGCARITLETTGINATNTVVVARFVN